MENKHIPKDEEEIINEYTKDYKRYNIFMYNLFLDLTKYNSLSLLESKKKKKNDLIKNMKYNVEKLVKHIEKLEEKKYIEIYRCLSCIFGAFLGDAIGAYCEFKKPSLDNIKTIFKGNPMFGENPGQITDDSEMAMALAFGIMDTPDIFHLNSEYLFYYYGLWHKSHPRDEGITTRKALKLFDKYEFNPNIDNNYKEAFDSIQKTNEKSLANGFLMRTSPFIVWCYFIFQKDINEIFKEKINKENNQNKLFSLFELIKNEARKDNICTHPNKSLCISHSIFCIMGICAIYGLNSKQIISFV